MKDMINNTVYLFWIGDSNKIAHLKDKLRFHNFNVVVGPSLEEHTFLYENFSFYKNSYDKKIWAFCSDVWRIYILSKYPGLYIDTSVRIGEDFEIFYKHALSNETYVVRRSGIFIDVPVLASNIENNPYFQNCLDLFKMIPDRHPRTVFYSGDILTKVSWDFGASKEKWEVEKVGGLFIDVLPTIRNEKTIFKFGNSTSSFNLKNDTYLNDEKNFSNRKPAKWMEFHIEIFSKHGLGAVQIAGLRDSFKYSTSKQERKELSYIYKNKGFRAPFSRMLMWERLNRIFKKFLLISK